MARKIEVDLVANSKPFNNALDQAVQGVKGFKSRIAATGGGSLTKGLAIGAGVASFNLLTSAISAGVSQLDALHQAFLDDEASQARLNNVLKNSVKDYDAASVAVEAFTKKQIEMGFADDDTRDSVGQLVGVTHDYRKAIDLATLSGDIARAKNIDLATATDAVTRAYNGSSRGLIALGIDVRGAANGTELLARAQQNVNGAMEAFSNTSAGRLARANAKLDESFEKLGGIIDQISQAVIPPLVEGLGFAVNLLDLAGQGASTLAGVLNTVLGPALAALKPILDVINGALSTVVNGLQFAISLGQSVGGGSLSRGNGTGLPQSTPQGGGVTSTTYQGTFLVPSHHSGGVVQGPYGSDQLIMAQAGERIIPTGQSAGQTIIVNIASFIGSDRDIDRFSDRLAFRLRSTSLS